MVYFSLAQLKQESHSDSGQIWPKLVEPGLIDAAGVYPTIESRAFTLMHLSV